MPRYDRYLLRLPETALGVLAQFRYQNSHSRGIGCLDRPSPKLLALPSARDIRQTRKSSDQMPAQSSRIWDCLTVLSETTARDSSVLRLVKYIDSNNSTRTSSGAGLIPLFSSSRCTADARSFGERL